MNKKHEVEKTIEASAVEARKWGYKCPECGGTLLPDTEGDRFDKLDKEAFVIHDCDKCGAEYSALYTLHSLQKLESYSGLRESILPRKKNNMEDTHNG